MSAVEVVTADRALDDRPTAPAIGMTARNPAYFDLDLSPWCLPSLRGDGENPARPPLAYIHR
ncbi:hypothetical protein [Mycolicibacterium baixiangningiae]|uniref:hypothetical protein n=1 Tax=Mycolicibacterium baixiangningiae TaxID=2761578 RepID=UPI001E2E38DE|nr:hypothetical protein [Mycolicibacterium baixiangningiae]